MGAIGVFSEQQAILIFDKEFFGKTGLATKLSNNGSCFGVYIRKFIQVFTESGQVIRHPSKMCVDEGGFRMFAEYVPLFLHHYFPARVSGRISAMAIREVLHFQPSLIL